MKVVMEKIDIVVKLKEKIAEAKKHNDMLASQLQTLLDGILQDNRTTPAI
jgi:hypothetical protein